MIKVIFSTFSEIMKERSRISSIIWQWVADLFPTAAYSFAHVE